MRVLILGGTSQASQLARTLARRRDIAAVLSFAGRTRSPVAPPIPFRIGGFGGVEGLRAYLRDAKIDAVIDATHPFAEQMSRNAEAACALENRPLAVLTRPPWTRRFGDDWMIVPDAASAAGALGSTRRRVFLTQGRLRLASFAAAPQHFYLVRAIDPPDAIDALPDHRLILARGPFAVADERALMRECEIDILVTKNSGGAATYAKIEAARALGVKVVMIARPPHEDADAFHETDAALAWIEAHRRAP